MTQHLFKLIWNRRRSNLLIATEIFFSFLVLFAVIAFGVYYADSYRRPLGFAFENVWQIDAYAPPGGYGSPETGRVLPQLFLALGDFSEIETVACMSPAPYYWQLKRDANYKDRKIMAYASRVTDGVKEVLGLEIIHGRWFEKTDDALQWNPVVINQKLSTALFGTEDPLGKTISKKDRVVGVVSDFRILGEFSDPEYFIFDRITMSKHDWPEDFVIKVRKNISEVKLEENLIKTLRGVAGKWTFFIQPLSQRRAVYIKDRLLPLLAAGIVAAFLMMMVGLGLMGVLWQNVTQRTKEIGLRRSSGATAQHIYKQILGELLVITTLGVLAGTLLIVQFPLLKLFSFLSAGVCIISLAISIALMYLLTVLCGLYPARLATKVHPAEALHYE